MNLLYTTIESDTLFNNREERVSEWRKQRHIVDLMPVDRVEKYLRYEISSSLALVDAIVCEADTQIGSFTEGTCGFARNDSLAKALRLAGAVSTLPEGCAMRDGRKWKRIPFIIFANPAENDSLWTYGESLATVLPAGLNRYPSAALRQIRECVDEYYDRLFRDSEAWGRIKFY